MVGAPVVLPWSSQWRACSAQGRACRVAHHHDVRCTACARPEVLAQYKHYICYQHPDCQDHRRRQPGAQGRALRLSIRAAATATATATTTAATALVEVEPSDAVAVAVSETKIMEDDDANDTSSP